MRLIFQIIIRTFLMEYGDDMICFRAQAQLEYALLIGAVVAVIIAVLYHRRNDFRRIPKAIYGITNTAIQNFSSPMVETDY